MNFRTLTLILFICFYANEISAQAGQWLWIKGLQNLNGPGHYGVQGVPAPANHPPARYETNEWTDLNGNFWIYGGEGPLGEFADLWKYDPLTNEWTWVKGSQTNNTPGNYGVKGIASPSNAPPSVHWGACTWTDATGDLWLFGGYNDSPTHGVMADMWRYNISSNTWTWMNGPGNRNSPGVYGIRTIADTANYPASRMESSASWCDSNDNLWLFSGDFIRNDLWKFEISSNTWTWMKGDSVTNTPGFQSGIGIEDSLNNPSARSAYAHWIDHSGNFWMFGGGTRMNFTFEKHLSDLWKFNPATNNWTYMGGENNWTNFADSMGATCNISDLNWPKVRMETRSVWTDANGDFWLYGGMRDSFYVVFYNDLWKYCVATNRWIPVDGNSSGATPVYGSLGVPDPLNTPGGRAGAVAFRNGNDLYLFGGIHQTTYYFDFYSDLWKYTIDTTCAPCQSNLLPYTSFNFTDSSYCGGSCVNFSNQTQNANSFQWIFTGGSPSSSTNANPQNICYSTPGNFDVTLLATNAYGTDTFTIQNAITVTSGPTFAPVVQHNDTLFADSSFQSYQWYYNGIIIPGSISYYHIAMQNGNYSVEVTDSNGCSAVALLFNVMTGVNKTEVNNMIISSTDGVIFFETDKLQNTTAEFYISDVIGQIIYRHIVKLNYGTNRIQIPDIIDANQVYFLVLKQDEKIFVKKYLR
jgi:N-acetylneuraminic acid mutarotase